MDIRRRRLGAVGAKADFVWQPCVFCSSCFIGMSVARLRGRSVPGVVSSPGGPFGREAGFAGGDDTRPGHIDLLELYYCKHLKHMTRSDSHVPLSILELYHVAASIR